MKYFIDTNIFLDIVLDRKGGGIATDFVNKCILNKNKIYISWHTLSNLFYILEKNLNNQIAKLSVKDILYFANVVTVGHDDAKLALDLDVADFEDALQIVSAKAVDADYIITRNKKDFVNSPIMAILPEEVGLVG
jgi:predicted nucleic acid-binding protein